MEIGNNKGVQYPYNCILNLKIMAIHFIRKAKKSVDGADGFLFLHQWATGFQ
jgi:hypothetical protein